MKIGDEFASLQASISNPIRRSDCLVRINRLLDMMVQKEKLRGFKDSLNVEVITVGQHCKFHYRYV